jgi:hypothetical protein
MSKPNSGPARFDCKLAVSVSGTEGLQTRRWREMDSNHWSPVGGQHFSRPPFGRSGLALPRGRRSVPPKRRGRSAVDEVGLIDIVGRWNSSLNINLTPVVDDEDRLPFAWAGQATLDHVR